MKWRRSVLSCLELIGSPHELGINSTEQRLREAGQTAADGVSVGVIEGKRRCGGGPDIFKRR